MPEFDFATRYAGYAKTILSACFFAPLVPLVTVVATVGIAMEYALDKVKQNCRVCDFNDI